MKLHHTGFVIKNIDTWEINMVYEKKIADIYDPVQNARLALYSNYSDTMIELIQPHNERAFTWNSLMKYGNHFNHFCYEIDDYSDLNTIVSKMRMIKVLGPVPALLFDMREVVFYFTKNSQIVEFLINKIQSDFKRE